MQQTHCQVYTVWYTCLLYSVPICYLLLQHVQPQLWAILKERTSSLISAACVLTCVAEILHTILEL